MKWAAVIEYLQDPTVVQQHRPAHRAYLTSLIEAGKLVCSGPFMDDFGALIVYEAADRAAAEALVEADPFRVAGVFLNWTLRPWKMVFANPPLLHLD